MGEEPRERALSRLELAASVCWLAMDFGWMDGLDVLALAASVPTVACSFVAVRFASPSLVGRAVVAAMAFWASMNTCWMLNDLQLLPSLWPARACFAVGAGLLLVAGVSSGSAAALLAELRRNFRRLRG
jgi:hypothetical protein